jgi:hypothetical protein
MKKGYLNRRRSRAALRTIAIATFGVAMRRPLFTLHNRPGSIGS